MGESQSCHIDNIDILFYINWMNMRYFLFMNILPLQMMEVLFAVPVCSLQTAYVGSCDHLPLLLKGQSDVVFHLKCPYLQLGKHYAMFAPC